MVKECCFFFLGNINVYFVMNCLGGLVGFFVKKFVDLLFISFKSLDRNLKDI